MLCERVFVSEFDPQPGPLDCEDAEAVVRVHLRPQ
jgi:hypothetical protein